MAKYSRLKTVSSTRTVRYIFVAKNIIILWSCYIINPFQSVNTWYCSYIFKLMNIPKISTSYFSENLNLIHFVTVNTHVCCWRFELAGNITVNVVPKKTCLQYFLLILKHRRSWRNLSSLLVIISVPLTTDCLQCLSGLIMLIIKESCVHNIIAFFRDN